MNALTELKHGLEEVWESLSEGWNHIRERAASGISRVENLVTIMP